MSDMSGVDPLTARIEQLQHALTTATGHAEGAGGRITVDCTADGLIRHWHVDDALLRAGDTRAILDALVGLQHQAVDNARKEVRAVSDELRADPHFADTVETLADHAANAVPPAPRRPVFEDDEDDYRPASIMQNPLGNQRHHR